MKDDAQLEVLLVHPKTGDIRNARLPNSLSNLFGHVMPMGLAHVAGALKASGIAVRVIDAEAEQLPMEDLAVRMGRLKPRLVGVSATTPTVHSALAVARLAKQAGAMVVIGGPQVAAMPQETMHLAAIDFAIAGEGEVPMVRLVEALQGKLAFDDVPGLLWRDSSSTIRMNPPHVHDTLDGLAGPARDLFPNHLYRTVVTRGTLATVVPGRGCPYRCAFCFKQPSDSRIRFRRPEEVADEMEAVVRDYGVAEIGLVSDQFTADRAFVEGLCAQLIARQFRTPWNAEARADTVDLDLLRRMRQAGCQGLRFGVESGSPQILERMNKNIDPKVTLKTREWVREAGIEFLGLFIIGYLGETRQTIEETFAFIDQLKPDMAVFAAATPLPGTKLLQESVNEGVIPSNYWTQYLFDEQQPPLPYLFNDTEKWMRKAYRRFFLSPRFLFGRRTARSGDSFAESLRALMGILRVGRGR